MESRAKGSIEVWYDKVRGRFHQHIYMQLLHAQITKIVKKTDDLIALFTLLGLAHAKAVRKMLLQLTLGGVR